jgi:hypothetical protein
LYFISPSPSGRLLAVSLDPISRTPPICRPFFSHSAAPPIVGLAFCWWTVPRRRFAAQKQKKGAGRVPAAFAFFRFFSSLPGARALVQ